MVVGEVEYNVIPEKKIIYIDEIAVYGENKRKGYGAIMLMKLIEKYSRDIRSYNIVGVSTGDAIPFWEKMGASLADEKKNGDTFFMLTGVSLFVYLRDKKKVIR